MPIIKKLLPATLYRMISTYRTWKRSQDKDTLLKQRHPATLQRKHLSQIQVHPNRRNLLEQMPQGGICVEVGVAEGDFSRIILDVMKPKKLILIDLWSENSERYSKSMDLALAQVQPEIEAGLVEIKRGWSWEMLGTLEDQSIDWIYIDAGHEYDSVSRDLEAAGRKIKPSGIIAGHDYTRWSSQGINRWGVVEAVNEFCIENDWEILHLSFETHQHSSFALKSLKT